MICYAIRHKATGELMPELRRTRGYSHWNPSVVKTEEVLGKKLMGVPRLLPTFKRAKSCIASWNANPNAREKWQRGGMYGEDSDSYIDIKEDGRKKEDLEVIMVDIVEFCK